jgi:hypothetical protein
VRFGLVKGVVSRIASLCASFTRTRAQSGCTRCKPASQSAAKPCAKHYAKPCAKLALYAKLLFMGPGTMRANDPQPLQEFENKWARGGEDSLVMDKWFALQATAAVPGALGRVRELMAHPRFSAIDMAWRCMPSPWHLGTGRIWVWCHT